MAFATRHVPQLDLFATNWLRDHGLTPTDLLKVTNADQFLALGSRLPPTAQLIDGEVVVQNSLTLRHQHAVKMLVRRIDEWIEAAPGRGQVGLSINTKVDGRNVYTPDVWWYCEFRKPGLDGSLLEHQPDLVVEVLSPSTRRYDLGAKRVRYQQRGVVEYWTVDPRKRCALIWRRSKPGADDFDLRFELTEGDDLASPLLPGFQAPLGDVIG